MLLDVLLGIAIFAIFTAAVGVSLYVGQHGVMKSGDRIRAITLAELALEAARAIRDEDFALLTEGVHGVALNANGKWALAGTGSTSNDGFHTTLTITEVADDWVELTARTAWHFEETRSGSVALQTELTDWRVVQETGDWASVSEQGSSVDSGTPLFNDVAVSGNYAFVTSEISEGGAGLYVFDIANLASPTLAVSIALGAPGYQLLADAGYLYVVTGTAGAELQVFDIASPATLSLGNIVTTVDVPGSGKARALNIFADTLFVASELDATHPELFAYDIESLSAITLLDSFQDQGGFTDIDLHNGYAYLPSSQDTGEIRVADVFDPTDLQIAPGSGYNLTDVQDGSAIAAFGTSALLGRANGSAIEELILFSIQSNPVPTPPPGPWFRELGGGANDIAVEPGGRYAFIATDFDGKELQIVDVFRLRAGSSPEASFYDTDTGAGRGVYYDITRDRAYLLTNQAFIVLQPG